MTLSRKEFFRKGLFSLGDTLLKATGVLQQPLAGTAGASELPYRDQPMVAVPRNERCLVRSSGCFCCVERCAQQAIAVVTGEGIRIDAARCTGCGDCLYVCPVTPKAITLRVRAELNAGE